MPGSRIAARAQVAGRTERQLICPRSARETCQAVQSNRRTIAAHVGRRGLRRGAAAQHRHWRTTSSRPRPSGRCGPTTARRATSPPRWARTLRMSATVPPAMIQNWKTRIGNTTYTHVHHYCASLVYMQRASMAQTNQDRNHLLRLAEGDCNYTLKRIPPTSPIYRDVAGHYQYVRSVRGTTGTCRRSSVVRRVPPDRATRMRKRLLLIAFHFPPCRAAPGCIARSHSRATSAGMAGTSPSSRRRQSAYPRQSLDNNALRPAMNVRVVSALALDAQRHLSLFGRYPRALATPDRWRSWIYSGLRAGRRLSCASGRRTRSSRPTRSRRRTRSRCGSAASCALAHGSPTSATRWARSPIPPTNGSASAYWALEQRVLKSVRGGHGDDGRHGGPVPRAGTRRSPPGRYSVIPNGFDEMAFPPLPPATGERPPGPLRFLHSGNLYPHERNPEFFFRAVAELRAEGKLRRPTSPGSTFAAAAIRTATIRKWRVSASRTWCGCCPACPTARLSARCTSPIS
jgi:hypothetical protein